MTVKHVVTNLDKQVIRRSVLIPFCSTSLKKQGYT